MRRATTALLAAAVGLASWLAAGPARAQMAHVPENDWRQNDRHDSLTRAAAKTNFFIEIRLGPYLPNVDAGVPGGGTPFTDVFGLDCSANPPVFTGTVKPRVLFGLEVDYTPLRIPYVGAVGPGLGWSFTSFSNQTQVTASSRSMPQCSAETTTLTIMPMHASVVLRADELMRRTGVPLVPYGKFGVGMAWWRASNDLGTEKYTSGATTVHGTGLTPSLHFGLGAMLSLNWIEPQVSARLDQTTGVHHAYLFGEYYNDRLTIASNVMKVGASSWVGGLAIDF
jgi:hypothetical protein